MSDLLVVRRFLEPATQEGLVEALHESTGMSPEATPMAILAGGRAALHLVTEKHYGRLVDHPDSQLIDRDPEEVKDLVDQTMGHSPHLFNAQTVYTKGTECRTIGATTIISYLLAAPEFSREYRSLNLFLNRLNGTHMSPGHFTLRLAVSTVGGPSYERRKKKLTEAFEAVRPPAVRFEAAQAMTSEEARNLAVKR